MPNSDRNRNLTHFKKGQSGNPKGRPKGPSLTSVLLKQLKKRGPDGRREIDHLIDAMINLAKKGNPAVINQIWDRIDGKLIQPLADADGQPLNPRRIVLEMKFPEKEKAIEITGSNPREIGFKEGSE